MADASKIMAFLEEDSTLPVVEEVFRQMSLASSPIVKGGFKEAKEHFATATSPEFLLVDASKSRNMEADLAALAQVCEPHTKPIIIGHQDSVQTYRSLKAQGVEDYLVKPISVEQLMESLGVHNRSAGKHRFILVMGAGRGVGATSIAANLGWGVGVMNHRFCCLLDLDLVGNGLGQALGQAASSGDGIVSLLEKSEPLDDKALDRVLERVEDRLFLASGRSELLEKRQPQYAKFEGILENLQDRFPYLIAEGDYQSSLAPYTLKRIDTLVLVVTPQAISLLRAKEILDRARDQNKAMRVIVVLNKRGMYVEGEMSKEKIEQFLGEPVALEIKFDKENPLLEIDKGILLINSRGAIANPLKGLVNNISVEGSRIPITLPRIGILQRVFKPVIDFFS